MFNYQHLSYASVLATITAAIQAYNFYRDWRSVAIYVKRETEYFEVDGIGGGGETVTILVVGNAGKRPFTITRVGARRLFPRRSFVEFVSTPPIPIELTDGRQLRALVDEELIDLSEIEAYEVHDAVGNSYYLNVASFRKRTLSRIRHRLKKPKHSN